MNSRADVVTMMAVGGGFLGALVLAGPAFGRCGADPDCLFGLGGLVVRGGVIGIIVFSGRAITQVADLVDASDFYDAKHEAIYGAMVELDQRSRPIDIITVADEMRRLGTMGKLGAVGSEAYLAELANKIASV